MTTRGKNSNAAQLYGYGCYDIFEPDYDQLSTCYIGNRGANTRQGVSTLPEHYIQSVIDSLENELHDSNSIGTTGHRLYGRDFYKVVDDNVWSHVQSARQKTVAPIAEKKSNNSDGMQAIIDNLENEILIIKESQQKILDAYNRCLALTSSRE